MYGFGIPGMGFYHIQVPEKKGKQIKEELSGVLIIKEGTANARLVREELKLYDDSWDWKVNQIERDTFTLVFPSKASQTHFTRMKSFEFNTTAIETKITESDMLPGATSKLKETWVRVKDIPEKFRDEDVLKHVCKMVGKPVEVVKKALEGQGPDRVKIKCRKTDNIDCRIEFFFGDNGYLVTFEGEAEKKKGGGEESSGPDHKGNNMDDDESKKDEDSESSGKYKKNPVEKAVWKELQEHANDKSGEGKKNTGGNTQRQLQILPFESYMLNPGQIKESIESVNLTSIEDGQISQQEVIGGIEGGQLVKCSQAKRMEEQRMEREMVQCGKEAVQKEGRTLLKIAE